MTPRTDVPLAPLTTFHIGGRARFFIDAQTEEGIGEAVLFAQEKKLPLLVLGAGSNVLVGDDTIEAVVLRVTLADVEFQNEGDDTLCIAGAGASWDSVVDAVGARGLFGVENLAGIPGTLGGAAVQNIGAYGAELSQVFVYADTIHRITGVQRRVALHDAAFAYRTSLFKKDKDLLITRVALRFLPSTVANLSYPDLAKRQVAGESLATPAEIAREVRAIRAQKFPQGDEGGTAGSFFKNPIIARKLADSLSARFPGLPTFLQKNGEVKVSLAWVLDHVLALKGYEKGRTRLYEKQPLVIVARAGATATEVDALARDVAEKVFLATGILLEREVENFSA